MNIWGTFLWDSLESVKKLGINRMKTLKEYFTQATADTSQTINVESPKELVGD